MIFKFILLLFFAYMARGLGEIRAECSFHTRLPDDFIVHPGMHNMTHMHDFFGAKAIDGDTTLYKLLNSETSCHPSFDHSAYWMPALIDNGKYVAADKFVVYYHAFANFGNIKRISEGHRMITHNYKWSCQGGKEIINVLSSPIPNCQGSKLEVLYNYPECWNGVDLDSENHMSHMEFSQNNICPATHPVLLPRVQYKITFPTDSTGNLRLSCGPASCAHSDFVMGFDPNAFQLRIDRCLKVNKHCAADLPGDVDIVPTYQSNPVPPTPIPQFP